MLADLATSPHYKKIKIDQTMKILALILAREGSKRLPGKNTRVLGGKPLVIWSIDAVKDNEMICDILVSTDSEEIASICREAGGYVPWLRPSELATDQASSVDAAIHALSWYEANHGMVDGLLLLQPTSPFRTADNVRDGIELFVSTGYQPVISVSVVQPHPSLTFRIEGKGLVPFIQDDNVDRLANDVPLAYIPNGSIYLIAPNDLRENKSFSRLGVIPLIINCPQESLDIDTLWDFKIATSIIDSIDDF